MITINFWFSEKLRRVLKTYLTNVFVTDALRRCARREFLSNGVIRVLQMTEPKACRRPHVGRITAWTREFTRTRPTIWRTSWAARDIRCLIIRRPDWEPANKPGWYFRTPWSTGTTWTMTGIDVMTMIARLFEPAGAVNFMIICKTRDLTRFSVNAREKLVATRTTSIE